MSSYKPKTVASIDRKIEQLQALRSETYTNERAKWKPRLQAKFFEFNYNAAELGFDLQTGNYVGPPPEMVPVPATTPAPTAAKKRRAREPRESRGQHKKTRTYTKSNLGPLFADNNGNTWSGKGNPAAWIQAHEAAGGSREDFRQREAKTFRKTPKKTTKAKSNGAAAHY